MQLDTNAAALADASPHQSQNDGTIDWPTSKLLQAQ